MPENFARFHAVVLDDPTLQERLRTIEDWERFMVEALEVVRERGLELTADDVDAARQQALLGWLTRWA